MKTYLCTAVAVLVFFFGISAEAQQYSWQKQHVKMLPGGDMEWAPQPFKFEKGASVRYIDFDGGNDTNNGTSKESAWKHHPWDKNASGHAKACKGIHTYVFKRGVYYRGTMKAPESGAPGNPIRLTSDPSWGEGEAFITGGYRIKGGWKQGADNKDIPDKSKVWVRDLPFLTRTLYVLKQKGSSPSKDDEVIRIPIARMPNWKVSDPEDVKKEWWAWDNPGYINGKYWHWTMKGKRGQKLAMCKDTKNITGPEDLYMGAIIWAAYGWVDGTPYPSYVQGFDGKTNALGFEGWLSPTSRVLSRGMKYYLEDKPHYLDDEETGEYWFEKKGDKGTIHLILPGGQDPNEALIEVGKEMTLIELADQKHITVSGLSFRFQNVSWDLTEKPWSNNKFRFKEHVFPACIRVWGGGDYITVANCRFDNVTCGVRMKSIDPEDRLDHIVVRDCSLVETEHDAISISEGMLWGDTLPSRAGHLFDVKVLRNYSRRVGLRPQRIGAGNMIDVTNAETLEIAGNISERSYHCGINVFGGKRSGSVKDCPLTRILIYQNKVTDGIRHGDDCGNIETWQGGPAYVFSNISGNPGGLRDANWASDQTKKKENKGGARFGMAYYLDGAYKNYYFNNIGWGLSSDIADQHGATAMFQEIHSYQNIFFNNTAYKFVKGTRRQAPQAGRNKYLGNIWEDIGDWVFFHTPPAKSPKDGNEKDAGKPEAKYHLETNAFAGNVFYNITGKYGSWKSSGLWHVTFEEAKKAVEDIKSIAYSFGVESDKPVMQNPEKHDFRLTEDSAAKEMGSKCFVPWALYGNVGEWNFYPAGNDPTRILDEHFYLTQYYYNRGNYHKKPMFPLTGVNITKDNYVDGPLEDWTKGACTFNGKDQYAVCADKNLNQELVIPIRFKWDKGGQKEDRPIKGKDFKSPEVWDSNFCIEAYFKTESSDAILVQKMTDKGYGLTIDRFGKVVFSVKAVNGRAEVSSRTKVTDGKWHHVFAEADRTAVKLTVYIDGKKDISGPGIGRGSLENESDLFVAGSPNGKCMEGTIDFLRICLGTLKDAKTTIDELYAWQFNGPHFRDFTGKKRTGTFDAGALEFTE